MVLTRPALVFCWTIAAAWLCSCSALIPASTPIPIPHQVYGDLGTADHVVLLLPGREDRMEDFADHGFIGAINSLMQQYPQTAVVAVDAHWGYYRERSLPQRIEEDFFAKYPDKSFTLAGISIGGFGALLSTFRNQHRVEKVILLSPFLGKDDYRYLARLQAVGPVDRETDEELTRALNSVWRFLTDPQRSTPVFLAYGEEDRYTPYYAYLEYMRPVRLNITSIQGDHDWGTWIRLWEELAAAVLSHTGAGSKINP